MEETMSREVWRLMHVEPFQPFTVHVSDGAKYTVRDPRRVFASGDRVIVVLKVDKHGIGQRWVEFHPSKITSVTPVKSNGSKSRK